MQCTHLHLKNNVLLNLRIRTSVSNIKKSFSVLGDLINVLSCHMRLTCIKHRMNLHCMTLWVQAVWHQVDYTCLIKLHYEPPTRIFLCCVPFHHPWDKADTNLRNKNSAVFANNSQAKPSNHTSINSISSSSNTSSADRMEYFHYKDIIMYLPSILADYIKYRKDHSVTIAWHLTV